MEIDNIDIEEQTPLILVDIWLRPFRRGFITCVEGLDVIRMDLDIIARHLRKRLACGGHVKDGVIVLQGDQREFLKGFLTQEGLADDVEVHGWTR